MSVLSFYLDGSMACLTWLALASQRFCLSAGSALSMGSREDIADGPRTVRLLLTMTLPQGNPSPIDGS